ncbi:glutathione S-transferase family protein [Dyella sp.]|jgi:glutathione S-transferase|uniref:glutathione S-transferase family protein n=1 Tax=Dyella sp. TaxID=1869338 RepID=UPI002D790AFB|nr:glutathione S-transferase family protein [Dyella sp.]HET6433243.1 glutathione S-transferase family protein [Dyella sp.]
MYTLYYSPGTASMVVHMALVETGAPHELKLVDIEQGAQRDPAYLALNPRGVVPTLVIDGRARHESAALLMMLADRHPECGLAPAPGTPDREAFQQWLVYLSNTLMSTYRFWFYPPELGEREHPPHVRSALAAKIEGVWDYLDRELAARGPYLLGEHFSAADLLLAMLMRWSRNMPRPANQWPALARLAELIRGRESWQRVYAIEGLSGW